MVNDRGFRVAACAEFPNDNADLHQGSVWRCPELGAEASAEPREADEDDGFDIEIVDHLDFDAVDEPLFAADPAPFAAATYASEMPPAGEPVIARDPFAILATAIANAALQLGAAREAADFAPALLGLERLDDRSPGARASAALVAAKIAVEGPRGLVRTPEFTSQLLAWQGILRGESEDFAACGEAMLDEWSAALVGCLTGDGSRSNSVRRELRRHGVAAFGLVAEAA